MKQQEPNNYGMWIVEYRGKSERRESERRWEQKERRLSGEKVTLGLGLKKNVLFILVFFKCWFGWTGSVRFNRFQTLKTETEPNRNFFVVF
jgi:hypothetical protein